MKRNGLFLLLILFISASCTYKGRKTGPFDFKNEVLIKTTPVKDQRQSQLCWSYAMLSTIESEHLMRGDSVNLSTAYITRMVLTEQAQRYYFSRGTRPISLTGVGPMLIRYIEKYGAEPYDSYQNTKDINYNVLCRKVMKMADNTVVQGKGLDDFSEKLQQLLDENMGYMPSKFVHMLGAEYTPTEFAHSVCAPGEYKFFTSFTHHPFHHEFILEVPDNKFNDLFYNLPVSKMMKLIENSIRKGHPVFWEGDISEPGFDFPQGVATLPKGKKISWQNRQREFENLQTTDDHAMELIGIARDKKGNKYFVAKNSWGEHNRYKGFMYLSYDYVYMKTVCIGISFLYMNPVF